MLRSIYLFPTLIFTCLSSLLFGQEHITSLTKYAVSDQAIVGFNGVLYNNRALYCNNTNAFILTGDKPLIRFAQTPYSYGVFRAAILYHGEMKWLDDCNSIKMEYRGNITIWTITNTGSQFPTVKLSAIPMAGKVGLCIHAEIQDAGHDDQLVWIYGGAEFHKEVNLSWIFDINGQPEIGTWSFNPESCKNNWIKINGGKFSIFPEPVEADKPVNLIGIEGNCSAPSKIRIADAQLLTPAGFETSVDLTTFPIVSGKCHLNENKEIYWSIKPFDNLKQDTLTDSPVQEWALGMKRIEMLSNRIQVNTPDEKLNTLAKVSTAVIDGVWYDPVFVHGGMLWNIPFPGWRTIFGGTMYGWHDRVVKEARHYIAAQIKTSDKTEAKADTSLLMTLQDQSSRFFGVGRIDKDQWVYNFQSQFFDQLISEWRSSGDKSFEQLLRPALELHLKWQEECFDPDGDGVYESYINGWPTDSQWYNGGGTAEETSYAWRGHKAAEKMANSDGDSVSVKHHREKIQQIKNGFFSKLWVSGKGFSGAYREQDGFQRLHEDPWLYSIFLPIDAGLVSNEQAIESLYYTKWALQNDKMPAGGRRVWPSNWVPGVFSVRELYPGDNYHLALAYFLAGMGDDGWDIMKGTFYEGAFNGIVPGDLGTKSGGTDFNDCSSMFTRVLVEGLFGYQPDYPNNTVKIAPQFPSEWDSASIITPDFSYKYKSDNSKISASIQITRRSSVDFYLPVNVEGIKKVLVDGKPSDWELLPGIGQSLLHLRLSARNTASISVFTDRLLPHCKPLSIEKECGSSIELKFQDATVQQISDPQNVLKNVTFKNEILNATTTFNQGFHTVFANVAVGKAPQKRIVYFHLTNTDDSLETARKSVRQMPENANWECVNMNQLLNADVRTIYQQKYLSPRPNTVSVRIGTDGYSAWTFNFWKQKPPDVQLDSVKYLLNDSAHLTTRQKVPFIWNDYTKNIAFTSLWDNWPDEITVPVHQKGKAVYLLVCGSTNPMQCRIANANLILNYKDKSKDTLALIPPYNYWNLSPINIKAGAAGQESRGDYTNSIDAFSVPKPWPETVQLGKNCRAMLLNRVLKPGVELESITLQTLSQEVVVGLMGVTILK